MSGRRGVAGDGRSAGVGGFELAGSQGSMWSARQFQMYLAQRFQVTDSFLGSCELSFACLHLLVMDRMDLPVDVEQPLSNLETSS